MPSRLGASFVGVNFWSGSKRKVEIGAAREITSALSGTPVELVGVFVNEPAARIEELAASVGLDRIQLHGDEPDELVARFGTRVLRGSSAGGRVATLVEELARPAGQRVSGARGTWDAALERSGLSLQWKVFAVVLDSVWAGERYGGTGERWEWSSVRTLCERSPTPILIAGGITPETVSEALLDTGAAGIDVASGVESSPGIKDREKMERLFEEVARVRT
jgi:phosphoribosylanthranilate isomerase